MSRKLPISLAVAGIAAALLVLFLWPIGVLERPSSAARGEPDQPATVHGGFPPRLLDARPLLSRTQGSVELCGYGSVQLPEGKLYPAKFKRTPARPFRLRPSPWLWGRMTSEGPPAYSCGPSLMQRPSRKRSLISLALQYCTSGVGSGSGRADDMPISST
jgi:hypothetical protein